MSQKLIINQDNDVERIVISDLSPPANVEVVTAPESKVVTVSAPGPRGPRGEKGEKGDRGEQGVSGAGIFAQTGSYYSALGNIKISGSFEVSGSLVDFTRNPIILGSLFSGSFTGNGSLLTDIPTSSILDFSGGVADVMFPYIGTATVTGSIFLLKDQNSNTDFFIIKSGSHTTLSVTSTGIMKIGQFNQKPQTAPPGGIMYYNSDFWLGCD